MYFASQKFRVNRHGKTWLKNKYKHMYSKKIDQIDIFLLNKTINVNVKINNKLFIFVIMVRQKYTWEIFCHVNETNLVQNKGSKAR